jgi:glutaryl-CoA dehydrogenase (non-decarboxylating)
MPWDIWLNAFGTPWRNLPSNLGFQMRPDLDPALQQLQRRFRGVVREELAPFAAEHDRLGRIPREHLARLAASGFFGSIVPTEYGGLGLTTLAHGLLCEEVGRASGSALSLITVHSMVAASILRWGTRVQKDRWLPGLAAGTTLAAFALTEPGAGSDIAAIATEADQTTDGYLLTGRKTWISAAQIADLFLIVARCRGQPIAFLVEGGVPNMTITPIQHMLGFRASMLGHVELQGCHVSQEAVLGHPGGGLSHIVASALDLGRCCIAFGAVGLAAACVEASLEHARTRRQGGAALLEHQLIQQMLAESFVDVRAARRLCHDAARQRDDRHPDSIYESCLAKYAASKAATRAAFNAVQIHGAIGCCGGHPVERYFRDSRILEIIEGSTQIQTGILAQYAYQLLDVS